MKNRKKAIIVGACSLVLLVGGLGVAAMTKETSSAPIKVVEQSKNDKSKMTIKMAEELILNLYSNNKKEDFAKDWSPEKFDTIRRQISHASESKKRTVLLKECDDLNFIYEFSIKVPTYLVDGILIDDVSETQMTSLATDFEKSLSFNEKITSRSKDAFTSVKTQYDDIHTASETVMGLFSNEEQSQLQDSVNQDVLDSAKSTIDVIQNEKAKTELFSIFDKASNLLEEKLQSEKEQTENEVVSTNEVKEQPSTNAETGSSNGGNSTGGTEQENNGSNPIVPSPTPSSEFANVQAFDSSIIVSLPYATANNFTGQVIYDFTQAIARRGTAQKLATANAILTAQGYRIKVWDGYRPGYAQQRLWDIFPDPNFVAKPNPNRSHELGVTFDVTLCDSSGNEMVMQSAFDDFSERAYRSYPRTPEQEKNYQLLNNAMTQAGFYGYSGEWWDYTDSNEGAYSAMQVDPKQY